MLNLSPLTSGSPVNPENIGVEKKRGNRHTFVGAISLPNSSRSVIH